MRLNVWAWMVEKNIDLAMKLLKGERLILTRYKDRPIEVGLVVDGPWAIEDDLQFEFFMGTEKMGGVDQEMGGYVKFHWETEPDEDLTALGICCEALDKLFKFYELSNAKFDVMMRTQYEFLDKKEGETLPVLHDRCFKALDADSRHLLGMRRSTRLLLDKDSSPGKWLHICDVCHRSIGFR